MKFVDSFLEFAEAVDTVEILYITAGLASAVFATSLIQDNYIAQIRPLG